MGIDIKGIYDGLNSGIDKVAEKHSGQFRDSKFGETLTTVAKKILTVGEAVVGEVVDDVKIVANEVKEASKEKPREEEAAESKIVKVTIPEPQTSKPKKKAAPKKDGKNK